MGPGGDLEHKLKLIEEKYKRLNADNDRNKELKIKEHAVVVDKNNTNANDLETAYTDMVIHNASFHSCRRSTCFVSRLRHS